MASDVRDVLNLPTEGGSRPAKRQKTAVPRPNLKGLAREVQNLGGNNPIAIVPEISSFKKRRFGSRKPAARWEMRGFRNTARADSSLILRHWRRQEDQPTVRVEQQDTQPNEEGTSSDKKPDEVEDSSFAKYNVQVDVPQYSEDQYSSTLVNKDWTKDETDYLVETARSYDLRWTLIWDRYDYKPKTPAFTGDEAGGTDPATALVQIPKTRTMEDLKARYYDVARTMMTVQKPAQYMNQTEFSLYETMSNFNPADETRRKKYAENLLSRSIEEVKEEESLLLEVRRIHSRMEKFNQERQELYDRLDYPQTEASQDPAQDLSSFKTSNGLQTLLHTLMDVDKSKKRKSLAGTGLNTPASAGVSAHPGPTPMSDHRRESIAASTGHRGSIGDDSRPEKPTKKGAHSTDRRKLTEQEEQIYGVSTHDRLPSGPTFRYERINKILTTKSNAQHQRIVNTLAELDIPSRLNMPTQSVVQQMEKLLHNISLLLDLRKMNEKYEGEIKIEVAKKAEREKQNAPARDIENKGPAEGPKTEAKASEDAVAKGEAGSLRDGASVKQEAVEDKMDTS